MIKLFALILCLTITIQAQDMSFDLALLEQSLMTLNEQLPTPAPIPTPVPTCPAPTTNLFEEIRKRPQLSTATKPQEKQSTLEERVKILAARYRTRPAMVHKIMQDMQRSGMFEEPDFENTRFKTELERQLSLNLERMGSRTFDQPILPVVEESEEPESPKKIRTEQDRQTINKLAETIVKELKRDFPALTKEIAYDAAVDLFGRNWVSLRNKVAEQEARKFIREHLTKTPAAQHERRPSKEEIKKQAEQQQQRQQEIAAIAARRGSEKAGDEEWETD